ncbi:MAG: Na+/H+ antiporter NhaC family protein [Mycoplasmatales bacterium]
MNILHSILILLPLIITIYISIRKKKVILALYLGVISGIVILSSFNLIKALNTFFGEYLINELTDSYNAGVIILIVFISGFIALIEYSNGAFSFAQKISLILNTKIKAQLLAYFFGILIFFSDLGTPLIVGPVFSPIFDKMKIARVKLAYIIDSTASPMAILIPFTGWGIYIMSLIDEQINSGIIKGDSFNIFVHAIGFEFYSVLAVIMVPLIIFLNIELFSMKKAQNNLEKQEKKHYSSENKEGKASYLIIPILILFLILIVGLYLMGFPFEPLDGAKFRVVLSSAYFIAAFSVILLMTVNGKKLMELYNVYLDGMKGSIEMIIILIGAWALSDVVTSLGTTDLIINFLDGSIPIFLYPALIFITGTLLSSTTGSSWGTMAILMPFALGIFSISNIDPSILVGAVLSGSLFGDHLSPLSDTTIFSSKGCDIQLLDHVYTQLPYGCINALVSLLCFIGLGIYPSYIWLLIAIVLSALLFLSVNKFQKNK